MIPFSPELSLDYRLPATTTTSTTAAATISKFIEEVSKIGNVSEKLLKFDDYLKKLEDEMKKIEVFKRELPLCMLLLSDAIMVLKEELKICRKSSAEKPVLEEFIPLKKSSDDEDETDKGKIRKQDKMNWMSSVQLWNSDNQSSKLDFSSKQTTKPDNKKRILEEENSEDLFKSRTSHSRVRAFAPFKGCSGLPLILPGKEEGEELPMPGLSLQTPGINKKPMEDIGCEIDFSSTISGSRAASSSITSVHPNVRSLSQSQSQSARKQRRLWSSELHRRFVDALQKLGGCQAATPKQIRELMQVDGLTNDEVKSHLQKYRLHTRRVPSTRITPTDQSVVVLGGLWMSSEQYGESSKHSTSQSGSPDCPLQLVGAYGATSMTGGDSMEDEEDEKSESHSSKSHAFTSKRNDV